MTEPNIKDPRSKVAIFITCVLICLCWFLGYIAALPLAVTLAHNKCYMPSQYEQWIFGILLILIPFLHILFVVIKQKKTSRAKYCKILVLLFFLFVLSVLLSRHLHSYILCSYDEPATKIQQEDLYSNKGQK